MANPAAWTASLKNLSQLFSRMFFKDDVLRNYRDRESAYEGERIDRFHDFSTLVNISCVLEVVFDVPELKDETKLADRGRESTS